MPQRNGDSRGARVDTELRQDGGDVAGGGAARDEERRGDLLVRLAARHQPQHVPLAPGQLVPRQPVILLVRVRAITAVEALGVIGTTDARRALSEAVKCGEVSLQRMAARALSGVETEETRGESE